MKKYLAIAVVLFASQAQAFDLAVVGALDKANPSVSGISSDTAGKTTYGFGALLGWDLMPTLGMEIGAIYVPQKFGLFTTNGVVTEVALRFGPTDMLTVGAGPYYRILTGSEFNDVSLTTNPFDNDFGVFGSIQGRLPLAPTISILADVRYLLGLTDTVDVGDLKNRDLQFLLGLNFGI